MITRGREWLAAHGSNYAKAWLPIGAAVYHVYTAWQPHGAVDGSVWRGALGYVLLGYGVALVPNTPQARAMVERPKGL
jgi:hypothetical protein